MKSQDTRNRYFFGLGTIGRDMLYTMISMFFLYFVTKVLYPHDNLRLAWVGGILTVLRIFDALNDPIMGVIVDNTNTRWGKFKPAILFGAITGAVFMVLMFTHFELSLVAYLIFFTAVYLCWDITYGLNDIAYWSMMPALSLEQKQRERIGSIARFCANIGLFSVVVLILPLTNALGSVLGDLKQAWLVFAVIVALLMIGFQMFTLFGVKELRSAFKVEEKTTLTGMAKAIFKNDQLLFTTISMALFMIGYVTTTTFGPFFFQYAFRNNDGSLYSIFAAILGISQLSALAVFPLFSRRFNRKQLYFGATILVFAGYGIFFLAPMNMLPIGIAGVLIFVGQAFIQLLMLMFLADTIEYGQWKSGKRNQSVTLAVQPLINKIGGAIATGVVTLTLIVSGLNKADSVTGAGITDQGLLILKIAMLVLPLLCIIAGYIIYRFKYKIDKQFYDKIVVDLTERGDIKTLE